MELSSFCPTGNPWDDLSDDEEDGEGKKMLPSPESGDAKDEELGLRRSTEGLTKRHPVGPEGEAETEALFPSVDGPEELKEVLVDPSLRVLPGDGTSGRRGRRTSQGSARSQSRDKPPTTPSGMALVEETLQKLKDLVRQEWNLSRCYSKRLEPLFRSIFEILDELASMTIESSAPVAPNLKLRRRDRLIKDQWNKMSQLERSHLHSVLFVVQSQLSNAASTKWNTEVGQWIRPYIEEVAQKLADYVDGTRVDMKSVLSQQREIGNEIWELNHVYKVKRRGGNEDLPDLLEKLSLDLILSADTLLSSVIEQWVDLFPRSIMARALSDQQTPRREISTRDSSSEISTVGDREALVIKPGDCDQYVRDYVQERKGIRVVKMALLQMLVEELGYNVTVACSQEDSIVFTRSRSEVDGGEEGSEITRILEEAIRISSHILTGEDHLVSCQSVPKEAEQDEIFISQYMDTDRFISVAPETTLRGINSLVALNGTLACLRLALEGPSDQSLSDWATTDQLEDDSFRPYRYLGGHRKDEGEPKDVPFCRARDKVLPKDEDFVSKGVREKLPMLVQKLRQRFLRFAEREAGVELRFGDGGLFDGQRIAEVAQALRVNRTEFLYKHLKDKDSFEERLRRAYGGRWLSRKAFPLDRLLFEREKEALRQLSDSQGLLDNLDRVAKPLKPRTLLCGYKEAKRPEESRDDVILKESTAALRTSSVRRDNRKARLIDILFIGVYPFLYLSDVVSDVWVANGHFSRGDYVFFALTILFILGPMIAEVAGKALLRLKGADNALPWKDVFSLEIIRLLPRSVKSLCHGLDSRVEFDEDFRAFYRKLDQLRGKREDPASDPRLIQSHSFALMVTNERDLFNWKMVDCLNESAPQLLLQLVIAVERFVNGDEIGYRSGVGILISLACFSWTLHLCHFYMHYDGLRNNFKILDRAMDFVAHFLIVGSRFTAVSFVAALYPLIFMLVAMLYLSIRCIYLYNFSSIRWAYKKITKNYTMALWPVHRLFITPYILRLWRCDCRDDFIYHVETFVLAFSWPYLLDKDHPIGHFRWAVAGAILSSNFLLLPLVLKFNSSRHEESRFCKEDDPFWMGKHFAKKLLEEEEERGYSSAYTWKGLRRLSARGWR